MVLIAEQRRTTAAQRTIALTRPLIFTAPSRRAAKTSARNFGVPGRVPPESAQGAAAFTLLFYAPLTVTLFAARIFRGSRRMLGATCIHFLNLCSRRRVAPSRACPRIDWIHG